VVETVVGAYTVSCCLYYHRLFSRTYTNKIRI